jgi:hypothetical protein
MNESALHGLENLIVSVSKKIQQNQITTPVYYFYF